MSQKDRSETLQMIVVPEDATPFARQFAIEYDYADRYIVVIDGIRVSTTVLSEIFANPNPERWLRFERKGDVITVHSRPVAAEDLQ